MSARNTVAPSTIGVAFSEDGIAVEYLDGREVFYHGPPRKTDGVVRTAPGKLVQILVTDPDGTEGVLTYVNDRNTHDDILETTGVGRVFVEPGETEELFPGVTARAEGHAIVVDADPEVARGRVFVFVEDELQEEAYEIVASAEDDTASDQRDADAEAGDADAETTDDADAASSGDAAASNEETAASSQAAGEEDDEPADDGWIDTEYVEDS
ncbi:hypothetical protein SAMN06269185_0681 [Natronoarchaeum philippinense]|uniref:Uncharacterized protein n=1 Tax=Natronoarchaeum philippinense TaxID=558529 RepID=A0A285NA28_NATPI|nr:hypothetical protein SAMN06269185_0681 [Natronoarchaeum philippinense]